MNPFDLLKVQNAWKEFSSEHEKFAQFLNYVASHPIQEGDVISACIEKSEGRGKISSNFRVTEKDMELIKILQGLGKK